MSLRKSLSRNSAVVVVVTVAVIGVWMWFFPAQKRITQDYQGPTPAFFTTDDGQTVFVDNQSRLAPFEKDGKQAVRAHLYRCPNGTEVVLYLERYTERGKAIMEKVRAERAAAPQRPPASLSELAAVGRAATEVKRPGDTQWLSAATGAEERLLHELICPNRQPPEPVTPRTDEEK